MSGWQIWKRLLWKEWREGWLPVLAAVALPTLLLPHVRRFPEYSWQNSLLLDAGEIGTGLAVTLWGVLKASRRKPGAEFANNLPVNQTLEWGMTFLLPMLLMAAAGVWFGTLVVEYASVEANSKVNDFFLVRNREQIQVMWASYFAAGFGIAYYTASLTSGWMGAVAAIVATITGADRLTRLWSTSHVTISLNDHIRYGYAIAAAAAIGMITLVVADRKPLMRRRITSAAASLCVLAAFLYVDIGPGGKWWKQETSASQAGWAQTADMSFYAAFTDEANPVSLYYSDLRSGGYGHRRFAQVAKILNALDDRKVFIAQQLEGKDEIEILLWDTRSDSVRGLAVVRSFRDCLRNTWDIWDWSELSHVSPNGRHLLLGLQSRIGDDMDLWVVDLQRGKAEIALANSEFPREKASWIGDRAILSGDTSSPVIIDLQRATARPLPIRRGGRR